MMWKQLLQSIHNISGYFLNIVDLHTIKSGPFHAISTSIQKLPWFKNLIETSFNASLGDDHRIKFWEDIWVQNLPLRDKFPHLYNISIQQSHLICELGVWDGNEWYWEFRWRRLLYNWDLNGQMICSVNWEEAYPSEVSLIDLFEKQAQMEKNSVKSFMEAASKQSYTPCLNPNIISFIWQKRGAPGANLVL